MTWLRRLFLRQEDIEDWQRAEERLGKLRQDFDEMHAHTEELTHAATHTEREIRALWPVLRHLGYDADYEAEARRDLQLRLENERRD